MRRFGLTLAPFLAWALLGCPDATVGGSGSTTGHASSSASTSGGSTAGATTEGSSTSGHATTSSSTTGTSATTGGSSSSTTTTTTTTGTTGTGGTTGSGGSGGVLQHHGSATRAGLFVDPAFAKANVASTHAVSGLSMTFTGHLYAQPLYVPGSGSTPDLIIVATGEDEVIAFNAATGARVWARTLGTPAPSSGKMSCGNLASYGVTGTPVVDAASRTLYLDAILLEGANQNPKNEIFALSVDTGTTRSGWPVNIEGVTKNGDTFLSAEQGERGALALLNGTLYVPYGGLWGDCGNYHGWLVGVDVANPSHITSWNTRAHEGGAWGPSGVSSDGSHLYLTTGNTQGTSTWEDGEAVIRFGPGPTYDPADTTSYWAPTNWQQLDNGDVDIGGTAPILFDLPSSSVPHLTIALGKDGNAYLLNRDNLGGITSALQTMHVSSGEIINAPAVFTDGTGAVVLFQSGATNCPTGQSGALGAIRVNNGTPPTLASKLLWCANAHGRGSPIVTSPDGQGDFVVWKAGAEGDNKLYAYDGLTGTVLWSQSTSAPGTVHRFLPPIVANGRIYLAGDGFVEAFTLP